VGLYFEPKDGGEALRAEIIAVNEPKTLKVIAPRGLEAGKAYYLKAVTQSSTKHGSTMLKNPRIVRSEFSLTAQV
jgi:hypothetical protein